MVDRPRKPKDRLQGYADLADLPEDDRIALMAKIILEQRKTIAVCVDSDPPEKAERYIAKFRAISPSICMLGTFPGPVKGVTVIKLGPLGAL